MFNEEDTVSIFISRVNEIFEHYQQILIEYIFINDGSTDATLDLLLDLQKKYNISIIDLSRNFGKEAALSAGLLSAQGDVIVPIDVDLQDPPELILEMIALWQKGYEVVLAHRVNRDADSLAKKLSATLFYKLHNKIAYPTLPDNVGDFRLMDKCVIQALDKLPESRRFMKGILAWIGFKTIQIDYVRPERVAGVTKFNGWRLWNFALEGITSFSTVPLRVWTYVGLLVAFISIFYAILIVARVLLFGIDVPGYASIMVAVSMLGGLQLIGIGVIGEYLGRTYIESKRRPVYIVRNEYKPNHANAE